MHLYSRNSRNVHIGRHVLQVLAVTLERLSVHLNDGCHCRAYSNGAAIVSAVVLSRGLRRGENAARRRGHDVGNRAKRRILAFGCLRTATP